MSSSEIDTGNSGLRAGLKSILKLMLPKPVIEERSRYIRLGRAGGAYARLKALDLLGMRRYNKHVPPTNARSFMFVCHGNIMRSPTAELLLKRALATQGIEGVSVISSGIHATPGTRAHPWAQAAVVGLGLSLAEHQSKLITSEIVDATEVIFAMDFQNLAELLVHFPEARSKVFLLSSFANGKQWCREIPDPYFGGVEETRNCFAVLQTCVNNLVLHLRQPTNRNATRQEDIGVNLKNAPRRKTDETGHE